MPEHVPRPEAGGRLSIALGLLQRPHGAALSLPTGGARMLKRYPMIAAVGVVLLSAAVLAPSALAQNNLPSTKATAAINSAVGCTVSNATSADIGAAPLTCKDVWS